MSEMTPEEQVALVKRIAEDIAPFEPDCGKKRILIRLHGVKGCRPCWGVELLGRTLRSIPGFGGRVFKPRG